MSIDSCWQSFAPLPYRFQQTQISWGCGSHLEYKGTDPTGRKNNHNSPDAFKLRYIQVNKIDKIDTVDQVDTTDQTDRQIS